MNITVYCSSSSHLDEKLYRLGHEFGAMMAKRGAGLIYGGYMGGIMEAVAGGVHENGGQITAVIPDVFSNDGIDGDHITDIIRVGTMSERKKNMEDLSDAIAVLPGGIGTLDEFFEVFVLKSLGMYHGRIAVLNAFGFYDGLKALLEGFQNQGFLKEKVLSYVSFFNDAGSMLDYLMEVD